jgi:phosphatidylglycerol:prolipoprotein diacylglycerol transferase
VPFPHFDPVAFWIPTPWFSLPIRWYSLAYIAGILVGWRYAVGLIRNARIWDGARSPISEPQLEDMVLWVTLGVIVGGRLGFMLFYAPMTLITEPLQVFKPWEGGMSFHGGLIGVALALIGFGLSRGMNLFRLGDIAAPCAPIGLFFGRLANFVNGELWGRPTHLPWGMIFPNAGPEPRHPSQLYEAGLEGVVLFAITNAALRWGRLGNRPGAVAGLFLTFYGLFRFLVEQVRQPDAGLPQYPFGLSMGMILSLPMVAIGLWMLIRALKSPPYVETDLEAEPEAAQ